MQRCGRGALAHTIEGREVSWLLGRASPVAIQVFFPLLWLFFAAAVGLSPGCGTLAHCRWFCTVDKCFSCGSLVENASPRAGVEVALCSALGRLRCLLPALVSSDSFVGSFSPIDGCFSCGDFLRLPVQGPWWCLSCGGFLRLPVQGSWGAFPAGAS